MSTAPAPLGIVLVNYNRWPDTIECLESVFRSTHPVRVVVVDNGSSDASLDHIAAWARGEQPAHAANPALAALSQPPLPKPLPHALVRPDAGIAAAPLSLVPAGGNLGFAAGNNIGLALLFADPAISHVWLLNNDTVVTPDAAAELARTLADPAIGMAGTTVRYYFRPGHLQALGGNRFSALTGQSAGLGHNQPADLLPDAASIEPRIDFVLGASLAVSRRFFTEVGPMEEGYFLYFEEIDWATRNRRRGARAFRIAWSAAATVYHKEGGSIGSSATAGQRSAFSDYWLTRARLAFTRRFHPLLLPWHWLLTLLLATRRLLRRQPKNAHALMSALFGLRFSP
jgi:GT2 family glycosyltransferase